MQKNAKADTADTEKNIIYTQLEILDTQVLLLKHIIEKHLGFDGANYKVDKIKISITRSLGKKKPAKLIYRNKYPS